MQLDIVVPFFNEAETAAEFAAMAARLAAQARARFGLEATFILVDDGSTDGGAACFARHMSGNWTLVTLSRNFGKEAATLAGLDASRGDYVLLMDADLQHTADIALDMIGRLLADGELDMVYAALADGKGRRGPARWLARAFYRVVNMGQRYRLPENAGDFRVMTRRAAEALRQVRDRKRFNKGLYAWIGFRQERLDYVPAGRHAGDSKWPRWRLVAFSLEGITSFTVVPLRVVSLLGITVAVLGFFYGIKIVVEVLTSGIDVPGYPSLMVAVLVLGGLNLALLGLVGEYVWAAVSEAKSRPIYIVKSVAGPGAAAADPRQPTSAGERQ
ncbi:glycosyltransferase [Chelativorans intermedius]|uniref:Glycosyltransferase n=1 Tax=Chelativorans intermedius TaxID=515947 RepID=A0ABV6D8S6_9HYPH|nr:glycosyltransferase [Chelativorans intermedius]MCT8998080.1 glycosyltransferase [Chelativorans intermedius]